jgi:4'-phosphopantetheinyl transferase
VLDLPADEVHVWLADASTADGVESLLNEAEQARAARLVVPASRQAYVAAHGLVRSVLASYLDADPATLAFNEAEGGKPSLVGGKLRFNLSHTAGLAAVAVAVDREVGVDVERLRVVHGAERIARRIMTPAEFVQHSALPAAELGGNLLRVWARKEALVKASGEGVRAPLAELSSEPAPGSRWSAVDLDVPGYAAAVAADGPAWRPVVHLP